MAIISNRVVAQTALVGAFALSMLAMPVGIQVADRGLAFTAKAADARQGRGADNRPGDVRRGRGADNPAGDARRGRGADDAKGRR